MVHEHPNAALQGTGRPWRRSRRDDAGARLPARAGGGLNGRWLVLSLEPDGVRLYETAGRRLTALTPSGTPGDRRSAVAAALGGVATPVFTGMRSGRARRLPLCLRLAPEFVLTRHLKIPRVALPGARSIALLDLEQSTPLRAADVLTAVRVAPREPSAADVPAHQVTIEQRVVKLSALRDVERLLQETGRQPARIDCWDVSPGVDGVAHAVDIDLLEREPPAKGAGRTIAMLAASAVLVVAATTTLVTLRLDDTLASLRAETSELRKRHEVALSARRERDGVSKAAADLIGAWQEQPSPARVLDRLTRLLPDTDHLTSLHVRGSTLELAGYTASSAGLLLAMERSGWLANASLTSAATFEEASGRERFSLRAEIRPIASAGSSEEVRAK